MIDLILFRSSLELRMQLFRSLSTHERVFRAPATNYRISFKLGIPDTALTSLVVVCPMGFIEVASHYWFLAEVVSKEGWLSSAKSP
jgi:hypothetical protein